MQTKASKYCWILAVCIAFAGALVLIGNSYQEWQRSLILITISSSHPVSERDFPSITTCPPKGSHAALNYDLKMAQDKTLSLEERDKLRRNAWMNLIEQPDQDNAIDMSQLVNPSDLQRMYAGSQSLPSAHGRHGFEITVWDSQGSIESPGYK